MRQSMSLASLVCGVASAVFCVAVVLIAPELVHAESKAVAGATGPSPETGPQPPGGPTFKPKYAEAVPTTESVSDELATLEAVHLALTEVGDGSSYVWHHRRGSLSGVVTPVLSFKDAKGQVCRHIVLSLSRNSASKRTEGVACRLASGVWQLDG